MCVSVLGWGKESDGAEFPCVCVCVCVLGWGKESDGAQSFPLCVCVCWDGGRRVMGHKVSEAM